MAMIDCTECHHLRSEFAATCPHCGSQNKPLQATVVDLDISFTHLVKLLVKVAFAAIPALIIIIFVVAFVASFLGQLMRH